MSRPEALAWEGRGLLGHRQPLGECTLSFWHPQELPRGLCFLLARFEVVEARASVPIRPRVAPSGLSWQQGCAVPQGLTRRRLGRYPHAHGLAATKCLMWPVAESCSERVGTVPGPAPRSQSAGQSAADGELRRCAQSGHIFTTAPAPDRNSRSFGRLRAPGTSPVQGSLVSADVTVCRAAFFHLLVTSLLSVTHSGKRRRTEPSSLLALSHSGPTFSPKEPNLNSQDLLEGGQSHTGS